MNYIAFLTKEEKSILCGIITGKKFKELFKRNEQEFSRIRKGFRAKSLTEQQALSIAISNIDKPFIATWVNTMVERWLKEIQKNIAKLEGEGLSHSAALATTMLDSFFVNNVELYFELIGNPLDADAYSNLYERMENIKSERARNAEMSDRIKAVEQENRSLSDQVEAAQRSMDAIKTECEERVQEIEQRKNELESLLAEAQAKIAELQTAPSAFTNDDADYLAQFDDTNTSILPSSSADEIISLCGVTTDYGGQKRLVRCADLNHNGQYSIFRKDDNISDDFTNWYKISHRDGPSHDGFYGTWIWHSIPNDKDPSKNYILSRYNTEINPIEIFILTEAKNLDDLINLLKEGIECQPHGRRVMFSIYASKGKYMGILCTPKELNTVEGKTTISEDCIVVPVYEFVSNDIMRLDNGLSFYRNAFAGHPSKLYHLKSPLEIVKNIVFSSLSWNAYKTREVTRAEYRTFKDFIGAIPVDDITRKIGTACRCSTPAAKELLDEFLNIVWKYVDGDSLEDEVVHSAISANIELQEKAKALIRKDWETENESLLIETREKLDSLRAELKSATEDLSKAQEALNKTKAEDERLAGIIAEKEKLAADVEKAIAVRIQKARENAADFIASMAFVSGQQMQVGCTESPAKIEVSSKSDIDTYCIYPEYDNLDDLEVHRSWVDVIDTAVFELAEAGVTEQYRRGLAAFLCAAYINKQPLLLVGPNAIDIIQAFSAAVTAHKHGILCCEGDYAHQAVEKIGADGESIVIVNNFLTSGWINRFPEILYKKDIFYVFTHPYAEDIQVEPKSLYGFMLPLFTEFLVDKKATGKYFGGYFSDDFKPYPAEKDARKELSILSKFALSSFVRSKINSLAATMHGIYPDATADDDFLFCVFPIAYASMAVNELAEEIADSQKDIAISASLKRDLQYVLGEI